MKTLMLVIGGGIAGAVMTMVVQSLEVQLVKPAHAQVRKEVAKCYVERMEDVHIKTSATILVTYCRTRAM